MDPVHQLLPSVWTLRLLLFYPFQFSIVEALIINSSNLLTLVAGVLMCSSFFEILDDMVRKPAS